MVERLPLLIMLVDFAGLALLVRYLRRRQQQGQLGQKRLALILCAYWSFFGLSVFLPIFWINPTVAAVVIVAWLAVIWSIGYLWMAWLVRRMAR